MKINRNMSAVITNKQMLRTESKLSASMKRLSSGYKINSPGENPSGMAISNKMRAQIKALDKAENNTSDGISVMQIADGALNEATSILQRIRELAVQAANGTNSLSDRDSIQSEIDQLVKEVDRISTDTEYNTKVLLDGSSDTRVYATPKMASRINISDDVPMGDYKFEVVEKAQRAGYDISFDLTGTNDLRKLSDGLDEECKIFINGVGVNIDKDMTDNEYLEAIREGAEKAGCTVEVIEADATATPPVDGVIKIFSMEEGSREELSISFSDKLGEAMADPLVNLVDTTTWKKDENDHWSYVFLGKDININLTKNTKDSGFSETATWNADGNRVFVTDQGGFSMEFLIADGAPVKGEEYPDPNDPTQNLTYDGVINLEVSDVGRMIIQAGGNEYQTIAVRIPEVSSETMYLDRVDVTVYKGPEKAMTILDDAIAYINEVRSRIGAYQNRLEYCENSLATTNENMTGALSTLMDTDMAEEMTEYTQQNVLEQAAISVLSQANQLPQQVLSLLQQ